jgi:hypothetical protein
MPNTEPTMDFSDFTKKLFAHTDRLSHLEKTSLQPSLVSFCLWHAYAGYGRIAQRQLKGLRDSTSGWHQGISTPLGEMTAQLKKYPSLGNSTKEIQDFSLEAELIMLESSVSLKHPITKTPRAKLTDSCNNTAQYCQISLTSLSDETYRHLEKLHIVLFERIPVSSITEKCKKIIFLPFNNNKSKQLPLNI